MPLPGRWSVGRDHAPPAPFGEPKLHVSDARSPPNRPPRKPPTRDDHVRPEPVHRHGISKNGVQGVQRRLARHQNRASVGKRDRGLAPPVLCIAVGSHATRRQGISSTSLSQRSARGSTRSRRSRPPPHRRLDRLAAAAPTAPRRRPRPRRRGPARRPRRSRPAPSARSAAGSRSGRPRPRPSSSGPTAGPLASTADRSSAYHAAT